MPRWSFFNLFILYMWLFYLPVCLCTMWTRRGYRIKIVVTYRCLWATMCLLGFELWDSGRTVGALSLWGISPAHRDGLLLWLEGSQLCQNCWLAFVPQQLVQHPPALWKGVSRLALDFLMSSDQSVLLSYSAEQPRATSLACTVWGILGTIVTSYSTPDTSILP